MPVFTVKNERESRILQEKMASANVGAGHFVHCQISSLYFYALLWEHSAWPAGSALPQGRAGRLFSGRSPSADSALAQAAGVRFRVSARPLPSEQSQPAVWVPDAGFQLAEYFPYEVRWHANLARERASPHDFPRAEIHSRVARWREVHCPARCS